MAIMRRSRRPADFAWFTRIWKIQVLSDERPWNVSSSRSTASHVSCTMSSASPALCTYLRATRCIHGEKTVTSLS